MSHCMQYQVCSSKCQCVCVRACVRACVCACVCINACMCECVCINACMCVYVCVVVHIVNTAYLCNEPMQGQQHWLSVDKKMQTMHIPIPATQGYL